jgi:hypothetical protein
MMTVTGFETFGEAIRKKLVREIASLGDTESLLKLSSRAP